MQSGREIDGIVTEGLHPERSGQPLGRINRNDDGAFTEHGRAKRDCGAQSRFADAAGAASDDDFALRDGLIDRTSHSLGVASRFDLPGKSFDQFRVGAAGLRNLVAELAVFQ